MAASEGSGVRWLPARETPWPVDVLDVHAVTGSLTSMTSDPQMAANAVSYRGDDGLEFGGQEPPVARLVPVSLRYRVDGGLADGVMFAPETMEHKWAVFHRDQALLFVRSWQRRVFVVARTQPDGDVGPDLRAAALAAFGMFGGFAQFATPYRFTAPSPESPLRSDSLLHIASPAAIWARRRSSLMLAFRSTCGPGTARALSIGRRRRVVLTRCDGSSLGGSRLMCEMALARPRSRSPSKPRMTRP